MKSILYHLSVRSKVVLVLTVFAFFIILFFTGVNIHQLRQEKRGEYVERLKDSTRDFQLEVEDALENLSETARSSGRIPALIRALRSSDSALLSRMVGNLLARSELDAIGVVKNRTEAAAFAASPAGMDQVYWQNIRPYLAGADGRSAGLCRITGPGVNRLAAFAFEPVDSLGSGEYSVVALRMLDEEFCARIASVTGTSCTIWAGTEPYATSETGPGGEMIFDTAIDDNDVERIFARGDTVLVETDIFSKRDWSLVTPLACALGNSIGMFSVSIDAAELAAQQWRIVTEEVLIAVGMFILILIVSIFLARAITAPLEAFKEMAFEISAGRTDVPEFEINGKDEINALKASFNKMIHERKLRLEREKAYLETQRRRLAELEMLSEIATAVNVNRDLEDILQLILQKSAKAVGAERGAIALLDDDRNIIKQFNLGNGPGGPNGAFARHIADKIAGKDDAVLICGEAEEEELSGAGGNACCIPFRSGDRLMGFICLLLDRGRDRLSEEQERVMNIVSAHSVRVIENVQLYDAERERERLKNELSLAQDIQSRLLSNTKPAVPNFDIVAHNVPSYEVSGDYFDIVQLTDDEYAISIGDVAGKGAAAALLMAYVQASVRALLLEAQPLETLVSRINNLIFDNTDSSKFITFFIAILRITDGRIRYVNAGHNPPALMRAVIHGESGMELLRTGGPLLGGFRDMAYEAGTALLERGDVLFMYTDGISEAMNDNEEEFGEDRIIERLRNTGTASSEEIRDSVLAEVRAFAGRKPQADDMTMVIVRRK